MLERRGRTRARVEQLGLDVGELNVASGEEPAVRLRPTEEALARAQCLAVISALAMGFDRDMALPDIERLALDDRLTEEERRVMDGGLPYSALTEFSWRQEASLTLSWALGLTVLTRNEPDDEAMVNTLLDATASDCKPRPSDELLDELDWARCYRALYARADAENSENKSLQTFAEGTIRWRHAALVWFTNSSCGWPPGREDDPLLATALRT